MKKSLEFVPRVHYTSCTVTSVSQPTVWCHAPLIKSITFATSFDHPLLRLAVRSRSCSIPSILVVAGETVRYYGRLPAQRLHPGTAHVHGNHGTELVATDALSPGDT